MKKNEIEVGKMYTDTKGGVRLVIAAGPEYVLYDGQENRDCLRYKILKKKRGPYPVGSEQNCTRTSFANWAVKELLEKDTY